MRKRVLLALGCALTMATLTVPLAANAASADQPWQNDAPHKQWNQDVAGKRIVYFPVSNSSELPHEWGVVMKKQFEALGIKFEIQDPDFDAQREQQMIAAMIPQKPALMIVHNPNVQVLAGVLKQAEQAGIPVIQVNMASKYRTDAYVGIDPQANGVKMADAIVGACGGPNARSHKVALMNGEVTSAYSMGIMEGAMSVFNQHKEIQIVSNQAANWDPKVAHDKAVTVLQAHPDLCAYMGWYIQQDVGLIQAEKEANLVGKLKIFTTGGGSDLGCKYLEDGSLYMTFNYQADMQAHEMVAIAKLLLQTGKPAGTFKTTIYTGVIPVTKKNIKDMTCYKTS